MISYLERLKELDIILTNPTELDGSNVFLRVDLNGPTSEEGRLLGHYKIMVYGLSLPAYDGTTSLTLVATHQGKGKPKDLIDYAKYLSRYAGIEVGYIYELEWLIKKLQGVHLLPNMRAYSFEKASTYERMRDPWLRKIADTAEIYVNDALAVSHRKDATVTTLPLFSREVYAGTNLAHELGLLESIKRTCMEHEGVLLLIVGGVKKDKIDYARKILERYPTVNVFLTGKQALDYEAHGYPWRELHEFERYRQVHLPVDEVTVNGETVDIGEETINYIADLADSSDVIVIAGAPGVFERGYNNTLELLKQLPPDRTLIAGGHTSDLLYRNKELMDELANKGLSVLTAGGAALQFLADEKLPGLEALIFQKSFH